ncbi:uncharacterized protein [Nicotiana tomentosiformis]|uniref:uncharacterized protein n=1 Tax=Nicotiana tomentosiformis TaxID=4098 RepID=UPI00388CCD95
MAAATSRAGGGIQTPVARTPEQVIQGLQTPETPPTQLVTAAHDYVVPAMPGDDQHRLERFGRLQPPPFSGIEREDARDFLDREELHRQFEQLCQGEISVTQYEMRFSKLARHAIWLVPTDRERIRRFIDGLGFQFRWLMTRERVSGVTFDEERTEREAKRPRGQGGFSGAPQGGQFQQDQFQQSQSSFSALPTHGSYYALPAQVSSGNSFRHQEQPFRQMRGYFECGDFGHIARYCPRLLGGTAQRSTRPTAPAPVALPPAQPARGGVQPPRGGAQSALGRSRGGGRSEGGQARFYAFLARPDAIASYAVILGMFSC